jgi:alkanesulfonate monooxygenase SsuD/methylene tetrahydromethanopterin reductase-like flavin-dependent oxidoreductase (luciferase family)
MDIGIGLPNPIPETPGDLITKWARRADEAGFSTLATIDRIAYPSYESLIALSAAAAVTERIGLMTNVLLAPTRNPVLLAKEAAGVDQISGGRLTLGMAVGGRADDYELAGPSFSDRGRRFEQDLELMHDAWAGKPIGDKPVVPGPNPRPPKILIGGMSDDTPARVAKWASGWTMGGSPPDQLAPFADKVRVAWKDAGRTGEPRIVALTYFSLGDDVIDASMNYLRDYYGFLGDFADVIAQFALRSPEAIRDAVAAYKDAGADLLILDPTVADLKQLDRLAEVVL